MDLDPVDFRVWLTALAWFFAVPTLGFVLYLLWTQICPSRRRRRHRNRLGRYLRE